MKTSNSKTQSKTQAKGKRSSSSASNSQSASYGFEKSKLHKLFEDSLKDIYWAEKALTSALPKMAAKATSSELADAIEQHLKETEGHVEKVEKVFEILGKTARGKKCEAMDGLIKEGKTIMSESEEGAMRDAGIIAAAQKVEHYEIASYGTLRTYAEILGLTEAVSVLEEILEEEKNADETLTNVATSINLEASEEEEE
jgi:ferritin-like metal-binding protein YciE